MALFLRIITVLIITVLIACSAEIRKEVVPELYWPLPPQRPRVKFVDLIIGSLDVTGSQRGKFKRVLFGEEGEMGFVKPLFITSMKDVVYVTDLTGVVIMDFKGKKFKIVGSNNFQNPTGIAISETGKLFVADSSKNKVFMVDLETQDITPVRGEALGNPGGLAVDDINGRLLAVDVREHLLRVYNLDGEELFSFGGRGVEPGEFNFPYDVTVDSEGNIYVVDSGNFRVQIFDKDGNFLRTFGSIGTIAGHFARPKGIALDPDGHIYVVDGAFSNFQIFDKVGLPLLAVGSVGSEPGQFVLPIGITIDADGSIYVVDQINKRLQKFQYITYPDEK
jgi:DNA-binding beta-propeller fold protein YncE